MHPGNTISLTLGQLKLISATAALRPHRPAKREMEQGAN